MERKVVGWFFRNGKRIPIFEKSGEKKANRVTSDGNTRDLADAAEKARGVQLDSADRDQIMRNPRSINGERVALYNGGKKESATFNMYSDGDKELINFRREPWPEGLRRNMKLSGKKRSIGQKSNYWNKQDLEQKYTDEARSNTIKRIAQIDSDISAGKLTGDERSKARDKRDRLETSLKSDFYKPVKSSVKRAGKPIRGRKKAGEKSGSSEETYNQHFHIMENMAGDHIVTDKRHMKIIGTAKSRDEAYKIADANKDYDTSWNTHRRRRGLPVATGTADLAAKGREHTRGAKKSTKFAESYIRSIMKARGLDRTEAIEYIMEQRKKR